MIQVWRQQQPVGAVQFLGIVRLAPRLDVTGPEVPAIQKPGHATGLLDELHAFTVHALAAP